MSDPTLDIPRQEGFWFSRSEPHLPYPQAQATPSVSEVADLAALAQVEGAIQAQVVGKVLHYRGSSTCRCCGGINDSVSWTAEGWEWPGGLGHYVQTHHVALSEPFRAFLHEMALRPDVAAASPLPRLPVVPDPSRVILPPTPQEQQAFQAQQAALDAQPDHSLGKRLPSTGIPNAIPYLKTGPRPPRSRI